MEFSQHSNTPTLQHSNTPTPQYSKLHGKYFRFSWRIRQPEGPDPAAIQGHRIQLSAQTTGP